MLKAATDAGLAPRTARYIRAVLRAALNQALRWGLVIRSVATLVDVPRATKPHLTVLDEEQARTLVRELSKHRLGPLFSVALTLGLRRRTLGWSSRRLSGQPLMAATCAVSLRRFSRTPNSPTSASTTDVIPARLCCSFKAFIRAR